MRSAAAQAIIAPLSVQSASGGREEAGAGRLRDRRERGADGAVGGDAAGDGEDRRRVRVPGGEGDERAAGLLGQRLGDGGLEAGAEVGAVGAG